MSDTPQTSTASPSSPIAADRISPSSPSPFGPRSRFAEKVIAARAKLGWTQERCAAEVGLTLEDLRAIELGRKRLDESEQTELLRKLEAARVEAEGPVGSIRKAWHQLLTVVITVTVLAAIVLPIGAVAYAILSSFQTTPADVRNKAIRRCFSSWDGSNDDLVATVKRGLRDPASFQHIRTTYREDGSTLRLRMEYRAKNGFGGYNVEYAVGACHIGQ